MVCNCAVRFSTPGNKRPIWRETGRAWASDFLFVELLPGESGRRSGASPSREAEPSSSALLQVFLDRC